MQKIYNHYLACLEQLHTVRLSVAFTFDQPGAASLQKLKTPWRGECGECTARMLTDDEFVEEWEAKNRDEKRPPSLREVVWTFTPKSFLNSVSGESEVEGEEDDDVDADGSSDEQNAGKDNSNEDDADDDGEGDAREGDHNAPY